MLSSSEFAQLLYRLCEQELELDEVEEDLTFFDLGGTSRSAVAIVDELQSKTGVELSLSDMAHQTLEELVDQYAPPQQAAES